jgi:hypothetical protein
MATPSGGRPATGAPWTRSLPLLRSRELVEGDDSAVEKELARSLGDDYALVVA